jgi:uncharacterized protein (DUF2062 family)
MMVPARVKDLFRRVLHLGESPERTALAFALGVFIAFTPTYGLHGVSALLFAWLFRLNFLALMAGNLLNNPWTFLPIIAGSMWLGLLLDPVGPPPDVDWIAFKSLMWVDKLRMLWTEFRPYLVPFIVGHILLGVVATALAYVLAYFGIRRYREHQARVVPVAPSPPSC